MDDSYLSLDFKISPTNPGIDILIAELSYLNFESFEEKEYGLTAYVKESDYDFDISKEVKILKSNNFNISFRINKIPNKNWNKEWEKNYNPVEINSQCTIRAPFHKSSKKIYDIIIKPEMSFGTGHHETTQLMIQYIFDEKLENKKLVDIGCGTGILSIISEKMGAKKIDAVDIDIKSYNNTLENIKRNSCKKINTIHSISKKVLNKKYDIILCNITMNILVENFQNFVKISNINTALILSGFYKKDLKKINKKLSNWGFKLKSFKHKNNWVAAKYYYT